jgi:tripartite-type tricarboxylate transporter receptor subunit TctC
VKSWTRVLATRVCKPSLPADIVVRWNEAIKALAADPAFVVETEASGAEVAYLDPVEFKSTLKAEYEMAVKQAEKLGLRK